jgi:hypothetical protein
VRFISAEPLLGPVDLRGWLDDDCIGCELSKSECDAYRARGRAACCPDCRHHRRLDWVIPGGESGPGARPNNLEWVRALVEQCRTAGVACFVKQLGDVPVIDTHIWRGGGRSGKVALLNARNERRAPDGTVPLKFFAPKAGDPREWAADLRVREFPHA